MKNLLTVTAVIEGATGLLILAAPDALKFACCARFKKNQPASRKGNLKTQTVSPKRFTSIGCQAARSVIPA